MEILSDEIEILQPQYYSQKLLFVEPNKMEIIFEDLSISLCTIDPKNYLEALKKTNRKRRHPL